MIFQDNKNNIRAGAQESIALWEFNMAVLLSSSVSDFFFHIVSTQKCKPMNWFEIVESVYKKFLFELHSVLVMSWVHLLSIQNIYTAISWPVDRWYRDSICVSGVDYRQGKHIKILFSEVITQHVNIKKHRRTSLALKQTGMDWLNVLWMMFYREFQTDAVSTALRVDASYFHCWNARGIRFQRCKRYVDISFHSKVTAICNYASQLLSSISICIEDAIKITPRLSSFRTSNSWRNSSITFFFRAQNVRQVSWNLKKKYLVKKIKWT